MDSRIGLTFPQYDIGALIQITGNAEIIEKHDINNDSIYYDDGAERNIKIYIEHIIHIPKGTFPIRWTTNLHEITQRQLIVAAKIQESDDVISFHLHHVQQLHQEHQDELHKQQQQELLWKFKPGQHIPIHIPMNPLRPDNTIERTYTNSANPNWGTYRISVKRQGNVSKYLHDHIHVGDTILVNKPAGDFILNFDTNHNSHRPIVLLSNGIGITPMLSMLHHIVDISKNPTTTNPENNDKPRCTTIYWIHGATDSKHHPFVNELNEMKHLIQGKDSINLVTHVAYSQPHDGDVYDSKGRLTIQKLQEIIKPSVIDADYYMCGTNTFVTTMEDELTIAGVPSEQIHYEIF